MPFTAYLQLFLLKNTNAFLLTINMYFIILFSPHIGMFHVEHELIFVIDN